MLTPDEQTTLGVAMLARDAVAFSFDAGGFHWLIPSGDDIPTSMLVNGEYGGGEVTAVTTWIREFRPSNASVVIEVGANVGTTTLPMVAHGWRVIALEPVPKTFEYLVTNIAANDVGDSVEVFPLAVAPDVGTVDMVVSHSLGRSHLEGFGHGDLGDHVSVNALPLDEVVVRSRYSLDDVAWVWCDTNGSERLVIESGARLWERGIPLFAEIGPDFGVENVAANHFRGFVPEHDLGTSSEPRPISEFGRFVRGLQVLDNVLFV